MVQSWGDHSMAISMTWNLLNLHMFFWKDRMFHVGIQLLYMVLIYQVLMLLFFSNQVFACLLFFHMHLLHNGIISEIIRLLILLKNLLEYFLVQVCVHYILLNVQILNFLLVYDHLKVWMKVLRFVFYQIQILGSIFLDQQIHLQLHLKLIY